MFTGASLRNGKMILALSLAVLGIAVATERTALAWATDGRVDGYIWSVRGGVYQRAPGATVWAVNTTTGVTVRTVTANNQGYYDMRNMPPGRYRIYASWRGQSGNSGNSGAWFYADRPNYPARVNVNVQ